MIVVFVVDTSPSMGKKLASNQASCGLSRLDLAKMTVESITKALNRRIQSHNSFVTSYNNEQKSGRAVSLQQLGLSDYSSLDPFLLISTGYQSKASSDTPSKSVNSRVLVDFIPLVDQVGDSNTSPAQYQTYCTLLTQNHSKFEKALKNLLPSVPYDCHTSSTIESSNRGGIVGLNAALSTGLQIMSRYRLHNRWTENFGLGRLPSSAILTHGALGVYGAMNVGSGSGSGINSAIYQTTQALQPACLIILTDGDCITQNPTNEGGTLQIHHPNMPLRELYKEPFRWDQRIFCFNVNPSVEELDSSLKALCEVTGGFFRNVSCVNEIGSAVDSFVSRLAPPLCIPLHDKKSAAEGIFVNGGPISCFQSIASDQRSVFRAMLLYIPSFLSDPNQDPSNPTIQLPMWCIPENYFPSDKMDTLPPRNAQPLLIYSDSYSSMGSFNPLEIMKGLRRLDNLIRSIHLEKDPDNEKRGNVRLLQRDVYICEWLSPDGGNAKAPSSSRGQEFFPIFVRGASRNCTTDGVDNLLSIGILHVPKDFSSLVSKPQANNSARLSTLTLLPPDVHILLPLLIRAAEIEYKSVRMEMKRTELTRTNGDMSKKPCVESSVTTLIRKVSDNAERPSIFLDENWRTEMRAYMYRIPPYYLVPVKRCLRPILSSSVHHVLGSDTIEAITAQCFSKLCHQKIRAGEAAAKEIVDRLDHRHNLNMVQTNGVEKKALTVSGNVFEVLREMGHPRKQNLLAGMLANTAIDSHGDLFAELRVRLGDVHMESLLAFYETRRRWIFGGGPGETVKCAHVEGVIKETDSHRFHLLRDQVDNSVLTLSSIGASSLEEQKISKMGDYRERLLYSTRSLIGYGYNSGNSATLTYPDGSPLWSVDDDVLPINCFDLNSGEFMDNTQTKTRARVSVNFGNPFKARNGDAFCPKIYERMSPVRDQLMVKDEFETIEGSTNDIFIEGEEEAESIKLNRVKNSQKQKSLKRLRELSETVIEPPVQNSEQSINSFTNNGKQIQSDMCTTTTPTQIRLGATIALAQERCKPPPPPNQANCQQQQLIHSQCHPDAVEPTTMQDPSIKPDINLPPDWIIVWSKSQKRWYYFDKKTNTSIWDRPPSI